MLKVLIGKNYTLNTNRDSNLVTHELRNKKICGSLLKKSKPLGNSKSANLRKGGYPYSQKGCKESKSEVER